MNTIQVLDKGYVRLVDWMGSDLTPVNAARVSFKKESTELVEADKKLLKYLATHDHTSPFRHAMLQFEVKAPIMVCRQWWKYVIGSGHQEGLDLSMSNAWNEVSGRYVSQDLEFYTPEPDQWRGKPDNKKQGSKGTLNGAEGRWWTSLHEDVVAKGLELYNQALRGGMAAEQARIFLPYFALYTTWYWTASLQAVCHFLTQRLDEAHAQWEIVQYAKAVAFLTESKFPESSEHLVQKF